MKKTNLFDKIWCKEKMRRILKTKIGLWLVQSFAAPVDLKVFPGWTLGASYSHPQRLRKMIRKKLWRLMDVPFISKWLDGIRIYIYPGHENSESIYVSGLYEPNELKWLAGHLKPGMNVLDIGAHTGLYTLFCARRVLPEGIIIAIEPSEREYSRLLDNTHLNGFNNIITQRVALGNSEGKAMLYIAHERHAGHNTLGKFAYKSVQECRIEQTSLMTVDALFSSFSIATLDFIKIDAEGSEKNILEGAYVTIQRFHPSILIEISDRTLSSQAGSGAELVKMLHDYKYDLFEFDRISGFPKAHLKRAEYDAVNLVALPCK